MSLSRYAGLAIALAALAGANIAQGVGILSAHWWSAQLPQSALFARLLYGVWLPIAVLAAGAGLLAAYYMALGQRRATRPLVLFCCAFTLTLKVDGYELGWSFLRLAVNVGVERLSVGVNFVGVAFLIWLFTSDLAAKLAPAPLVSGRIGDHVA